MVTTIQLDEEVKQYLGSLKKTSKETYQDVIMKLLEAYEPDNLSPEEELLKEGYLALNEINKEIMEDFKYADSEINEESEWK